jgi:hypothetical protein
MLRLLNTSFLFDDERREAYAAFSSGKETIQRGGAGQASACPAEAERKSIA